MVKELLKDSFKNGNTLTNILLIIITVLVSVVGFFGVKIYEKIDNIQTVVYQHETKIAVIENIVKHIVPVS